MELQLLIFFAINDELIEKLVEIRKINGLTYDAKKLLETIGIMLYAKTDVQMVLLVEDASMGGWC